MKLRDWLNENNVTQSSLAQSLGLNRSTISLILSGRHSPSSETMRGIARETDNQVTPNDFILDQT